MTSGVSNNSNSRHGLYVAGGTLLGAGAGVGTAILTKPYLDKQGRLTLDCFMRGSENVVADYVKNHSDAPEIKRLKDLYNELRTINSKEALEQFLLKNKIDESQYIKNNFDTLGLDGSKVFAKSFIDIERDYTLKNIGSTIWEKEAVTSDDLIRNFKENYKKLSKETQESFKKAMNEITRKKAILFGGLGAAVVLLATSLTALLKNKKSEKY